MNKQEYYEKRKKLEENHVNEKRKLTREYLKANITPLYAVNDIIQDDFGKIRVKHIIYRGTVNEPLCVYSGIALNSKGEPLKGYPVRQMFEYNVIKECE